MPGAGEYDTPPKRVNHRAAQKYLCARVAGGFQLHHEDVVYLCERVARLQEQLDAERDLNELEVSLRQEAMRAAADERYEREMRAEP